METSKIIVHPSKLLVIVGECCLLSSLLQAISDGLLLILGGRLLSNHYQPEIGQYCPLSTVVNCTLVSVGCYCFTLMSILMMVSFSNSSLTIHNGTLPSKRLFATDHKQWFDLYDCECQTVVDYLCPW